MKRTLMVMAVVMSFALPAQAQLNGENLLGDMGVKSGTQPEPGLYTGHLYYRYFTDQSKGRTASRSCSIRPEGPPDDSTPTCQWPVHHAGEILGANFGMMAVMPFASGALEAPGLGLSEKASTGPSDAYVMPAQLGWHSKRVDFIAGVACLHQPDASAGASDNLGKACGATKCPAAARCILDKSRSVSLSTTASGKRTARRRERQVRKRRRLRT